MRRSILILGTMAGILCFAAAKNNSLRAFEPQLMKVRLKVLLDDPRGLKFEKVYLQVCYRAGQEYTAACYDAVPCDSSGVVEARVPRGSLMSVTVSSYDPTVRHIGADSTDSYSLTKACLEILGSVEFQIPNKAIEPIEKDIMLRRGAAFTVCPPEKLEQGMLLFRRPSDKDVLHTIWFRERYSLEGTVVGGLEPGEWLVSYVRDDGTKISSQRVYINRGEWRTSGPKGRPFKSQLVAGWCAQTTDLL